MNSNKAIIYDHTCPMCRWYTTQFVEQGMLEEENRISFAELDGTELVCQIDFEKGRHEIPLIDLEGGRTLYGLDSLVHLLNPRFPIVGKALEIKPIRWFFSKLYKIVSYNRRVIAPSRKQEVTYDCTPDFNIKYRLFYIAFAAVTGLSLLSIFGSQFFPNSYFNIVFSIFLLKSLLVTFFLEKPLRIEYLGQLATVFLIGGLLVPLSFLIPKLAYCVGGGIGLLMIWQLIKRFNLIVLNYYNSPN